MTAGSFKKSAVPSLTSHAEDLPLQYQKTVQEIMDRDFCFFDEQMLFPDALAILLERQLTGAPVLDSRKHLRGFLSLKDCLPFAHLLAAPPNCEESRLSVAQLMSYETHFLRTDCHIAEAWQAFLNQWFHVYPVVGEDNSVVGVLSRRRLLQFLST